MGARANQADGGAITVDANNSCTDVKVLSYPSNLPELTPEKEKENNTIVSLEELPFPPASSAWDWPLSRVERKERVVMLDRQMLLVDQKVIQGQIEELRGHLVECSVAPS